MWCGSPTTTSLWRMRGTICSGELDQLGNGAAATNRCLHLLGAHVVTWNLWTNGRLSNPPRHLHSSIKRHAPQSMPCVKLDCEWGRWLSQKYNNEYTWHFLFTQLYVDVLFVSLIIRALLFNLYWCIRTPLLVITALSIIYFLCNYLWAYKDLMCVSSDIL